MEFNLSPPLSERTQDWIDNTVRRIGAASLTEIRSRKRDRICHLYYNGLKKDEDFDYLNQVGDYVYPAKVRFIQIIRPKIDLQLSKLTRRELNFAAITSDTESQMKKLDKKLKYYLDYFDKKITVANDQMLTGIQQINQKLAEMDQILSTPAKSKQDAELQYQLSLIRPELQKLLIETRTGAENMVLLNASDEEKIDHYWKYKYKDMVELAAQRYLKKAITEKDILRKSLRAFKDQCITGKPIYFVDVCPGEKFPDFEQIPSLYTCWSNASTSGYIQDSEWATYTVPMSVSSIISKFGPYMKEVDRKRLLNFQSFVTDTTIKTNYMNDAYFTDDPDTRPYAGSSIDRSIEVTYVYYRSPRKIIRKFIPNPHVPNKYFSHIIDESEVLDMTIKEGEKLQFKYIDDIYEGILIGSSGEGIVVNARPKPNQVYDIDTFKTQLPIIGYSFGDVTDEPYSYIWATKDLQDLYNILMFQAELLIVLSGVKGIVMDKAQTPDELTSAEWIYQRKMGVAWIDTMKKKFQRHPTFNQFQSYDDSLSQSVLYILDMARGIDEMAGQIIGVPRQAIGQTISTDQVGTNKMSIDQSALINEVQFWTHFDLLGKALSRFMNCAREQGLIDDVMTFIGGDLNTDEIGIPKDIFDNKQIDIIVSNSVKELDFIEDFKNIAINERRTGRIQLSDLIKVYQGNTLKEIESTLDYASKVAAEAAQQNAQNAFNAEFEKEAKLKEMDMQFKKLDSDMRMQLEQLKLQMKERQDQFAAQRDAVETDMKVRQQEFDNNVKMRELELAATEAQGKIVADDFKSKIDAINQKVNLLLGNRDLDIKERGLDIEKERVSVEREKVKKMNPNTNKK